MGTAYQLSMTEEFQDRFVGDARLYYCDPAMDITSYDYDSDEDVVMAVTPFVIVSASSVLGPETFIFPASHEGEILSWAELDGSIKGVLDHDTALRGAGYDIAYDLPESVREQITALAAVATAKEIEA